MLLGTGFLECSTASILILAQNPTNDDIATSRQASIDYEELDARLAGLQEQEALLRRQKEKDLDESGYLYWQRELDAIGHQIAEILCILQTTDES